MDFRTKIDIKRTDISVTHQSQIMSIGSCFAESIGSILKKNKFLIDVNPFGILYNPASIANSLTFLFDEKEFSPNDLFQHNDVWASLYHHSIFSKADKNECLLGINERLHVASKRIKECNLLFITFGTSWVYEYTESGKVVSNCHKLPAYKFKRYRLSVDDIVNTYRVIIERLLSYNPDIKIVFSVSPIRHWKDGAHENQLSKSVLLLAIDELQAHFNNILYFPSYELVLDDLRDYRFYEADMLHPNSVAIEYIWQKFIDAFFSKDTLVLSNAINKLIQARSHRPFNPNTDRHRSFLKSNFEKTEALQKQHPYLPLKEELEYFGMYKFIER